MLVALIILSSMMVSVSAFQPFRPFSIPLHRHQGAEDAFSSETFLRSGNSDFQLEQSSWKFQDKYPIAYEVASVVNSSHDIVQILLLNGFGVGSFHQHRLMKQLLLQHQSSSSATTYKIYGIDYLGQGKSWPKNCNDGMSEDEYNLSYSADLWIDQLKSFIQQVINTSSHPKVHLVGNSLGGYLGTILSYRHPELVSTLTLLNATPVWGLNLIGWDGRLPAPALPKLVGRTLFDTIRNLDVIDQYLSVAYVNKKAFDGSFDDSFGGVSNNSQANGVSLNLKIRGCTEGKGGHAAFASILWSPPASCTDKNGSILQPQIAVRFYDALQQLSIDVLLLFGTDDEWCTPAVAKRMHTTLSRRRTSSSGNIPCQRYVTIDNAGHCPNHEAPAVVATILEAWLEATDRSTARLIPIENEVVKEPWGEFKAKEVSLQESRRMNFVDKMISSVVG